MTPVMFSCEHATCAVPEAWRDVFRGEEDAVASSEGWEPGSLNLAQGFAMKFRTPLVHGDVTRLLIDLDGEGETRWSRFSAKLSESQRAKLVDRHVRPHREQLKQRVLEAVRRETPIVHVLVRTDAAADGTVTLEFPADHDRAGGTARAWRDAILDRAPELAVQVRLHPSAPAAAEGLIGEFGADTYAPVTLRVAQTFFLEGKPCRWEPLKKVLLESLARTLEDAVSAPASPSSDPR